MKNILTVLLVVAVLVLAVGVASYAARVDVNYVIGTWHQASLLAVAAVVAALLLAVGVLTAVAAGLARARERRVLEEELERTYVRLRAAEASLQAARPAAPATLDAASTDDEPATGRTRSGDRSGDTS
jgi:uncharacterized membrane protein YciS (DUF1049 family)